MEWGIKMYSADNIAKYIINWCNDHSIRITNLKLQKLLYFLQGEIVKQTGQRLIREDFYAWQLGPVIPDVYNEYSMYSSSALPKQELNFSIDSQLEKHIEAVLSKYARKSTWDLVDLSHSQDPWKYNHQIFGNRAVIPYKSIEDFFKGANN